MLTLRQKLTGDKSESGFIDAVMAKNLLLASRHGVLIRNTNYFESGGNTFLEQQTGAGFAETAVDAVLLDSNHSPCFGRGLKNRRLIHGY